MLDELPVMYFAACVLVIVLSAEAIMRYREVWSKPALAVYFTIAVWYLGDLVYNGIEGYMRVFTIDVVSDALVQVCMFLAWYRLFVGILMTGFPKVESRPIAIERSALTKMYIFLVIMQIILATIGLWRLDWDYMNLVIPTMAEEHLFLWKRGGVGQGYDFLVSFAAYIHIAVIGMIGILAAIAIPRFPRFSVIASMTYLACLPPYVFQRARNGILAVILPCVLAFVLNTRIPFWVRVLVATLSFLVINSWFFVIADYRESGHNWSSIDFQESKADSQKKHQGLDMFNELCYINVFIETGTYEPNWGGRYFAEAVAIVPRAIWKDKPYLGIDYAIARGFGDDRFDAGVNTSVTTGLIGQGSVNFGIYGGPIAAAMLMSIWTVILAKLWMKRDNLGKFALFMLGMGLTFNMGRDITLMVLFPFLFGYMGLVTYNFFFAKKRAVVT